MLLWVIPPPPLISASRSSFGFQCFVISLLCSHFPAGSPSGPFIVCSETQAARTWQHMPLLSICLRSIWNHICPQIFVFLFCVCFCTSDICSGLTATSLFDGWKRTEGFLKQDKDIIVGRSHQDGTGAGEKHIHNFSYKKWNFFHWKGQQ